MTAVLAMAAGSGLFAVSILSGKTVYPRWFVLLSPPGVLVLTLAIGSVLPAPLAGLVIAPFGTWFMLVPNIAGALWLWRHLELVADAGPSLGRSRGD